MLLRKQEPRSSGQCPNHWIPAFAGIQATTVIPAKAAHRVNGKSPPLTPPLKGRGNIISAPLRLCVKLTTARH